MALNGLGGSVINVPPQAFSLITGQMGGALRCFVWPCVALNRFGIAAAHTFANERRICKPLCFWDINRVVRRRNESGAIGLKLDSPWLGWPGCGLCE